MQDYNFKETDAPEFVPEHPALDLRVEAIAAVAERFEGKPLDLGKDDCIHMIAFGLKAMKVKTKTKLNKLGSYATAAGALRALRRSGFDSLRDAISGQGLKEIAPAFALPGDIIAMPAKEGEEVALAFAASGGRAFAFWNGKAQFVQPLEYVTAWRVA